MTVQMLICRRHGGKVNKFMLSDSLRTRCAFCDLERRALRRNYDNQDEAVCEMNRVLPKFNSARIRVITVVSEGGE